MNLEPLRKTLVALFLVGFVALYGYFLIAIIQAPSGKPPVLDERLVGLAATVSGVLGTAFAVALGRGVLGISRPGLSRKRLVAAPRN